MTSVKEVYIDDRLMIDDRPLIWKNLNGILRSARGYHSSDSLYVWCYGGVIGPADRMALYRVRLNSVGMWKKTMREE